MLERNPYIGGAAVSREILARLDLLELLLRVQPAAARRSSATWSCARHGLQIVPYGGGCTITRSGDILGNYTDHDAQRREFARHNARDADAYDRYSTRHDAAMQVHSAAAAAHAARPDLAQAARHPRDALSSASNSHKLGERTMYDTHPLLDDEHRRFSRRVLRERSRQGALAGQRHHRHGARRRIRPGTAYVLLHHYMGDVDGPIGAWGFARGGMGAVTKALAAAFQAHGGEISTDAARRADHRARRQGRRCGARQRRRVSRANVDRLEPRCEAHLPRSCSTRATCPREFVSRARNFKIRGSSGKLNIALDGLPEFPGAGRRTTRCTRGDMHFLDSLETMERAYDDWKNGTWSKEPYLDMLIPSMTDPTMAPPGKHCMSVFVQYVPPQIHGRDWTDAGSRRLQAARCSTRSARYSPNFKQLILHAEVRTPREHRERGRPHRRQHLPGRADASISCCSTGPFPGYAQYRGPVQRLVHVRLGHAPRRRRHGRAGRQCGARDPARPAIARTWCPRAGSDD